jgi:hypothetical protein
MMDRLEVKLLCIMKSSTHMFGGAVWLLTATFEQMEITTMNFHEEAGGAFSTLHQR